MIRRGVVVPADEEDCCGDVDEGVGAVEEGEEVFVAVHEEVLDVDFSEREENLRPRGVFGVQNRDAVRFGHFPEAVGGEELRGEEFRTGVESEVEDPVKHLDQEREFLDKAAVVVINESRGVGCIDGHPAAVSALRNIFGRCVVLRIVVDVTGPRRWRR